MPEDEVPAPKERLKPSWHHTCKTLHTESYQSPSVDKCPYCGTLKLESARKKAKKTKEDDDG